MLISESSGNCQCIKQPTWLPSRDSKHIFYLLMIYPYEKVTIHNYPYKLLGRYYTEETFHEHFRIITDN